MNKRLVISICVFAFLIFASRCAKDVGKPPVIDNSIKCDTITYTGHLEKIVDAKCGTTAGCHSSSGTVPGIPLTDYQKVKALASSIRNRVFVVKDMPMAPKFLTPEEKTILECWLNNGNQE